ncbi:MAG: hypothetical protein R3242_03335, partial [Akkermansiaceae bacterium]|nr:hypothetical protein [Akkermansiaceae bacterium]
MSLRSFILGLSSSFGIAWLAVVVIPYFKMRNLEPIVYPETTEQAGEVYYPKRTGRIGNGSNVYAANGCYLCHTQVVRPTYAGNDMFRPDWGGLATDEQRGDTRRETNAFDFLGESYAHIGINRMGPDLSNFAVRLEKQYLQEGQSPEQWIYLQLHNPLHFESKRLTGSACPPRPYLFKKRKIDGPPTRDALDVETREGYEVVPTADAKALASYLMSLKKDHPVPPQLDFAPGDQ